MYVIWGQVFAENPSELFTSATLKFPTAPGVVDGIGLDDLTIGTANQVVTNQAVPEPLTILGAGTAVAFGAGFKRKLNKSPKK